MSSMSLHQVTAPNRPWTQLLLFKAESMLSSWELLVSLDPEHNIT